MTQPNRPRVFFAPRVIPLPPPDASDFARRKIHAAAAGLNKMLDAQSFATDRTTALHYAAQAIFASGISCYLAASVYRRYDLY